MNYSTTSTLQSLSTHLHLTPNYLTHLFKKQTPQPFTQYLTTPPIHKPKLLLHPTPHTIPHIPQHTPFHNSTYFTTLCKQVAHVSPREYRKET
ncbi:helix-turn-helix domain-containing protein, partial [Paenibacillus xylanexedens]|uniref:helix-turn-helix domain-containing protein n=1 Tax=Paenibacillus xylanexedens TaxID=528191 RepID=UPI0034D97272